MSLDTLASHERAALELLPPAGPGDLATTYRTVHTFFTKHVKTTLELTLPAVKPQLKPLQNDVIWAYSSPRPPTKLNAELEGAALALISAFDEAETAVAALVANWVARGGLPFALEAVAQSFGRFTIFTGDLGKEPLLVPSESQRWVPLYARIDALVRSQLARATPPERDAALVKARELRAQHSLAACSVMSCIFLDPEWIAADLAKHLERQQPAVFTALALLQASDGALVARFLGSLEKDERSLVSDSRFAHALLQRFPDAAPLAARMKQCAEVLRAEDVSWSDFGPLKELTEVAKFALESETMMGAVVEALSILQPLKFAKNKDPRPGLISLLRSTPRIAAPLVRQAAERKAKWAIDLSPQLERTAQGPPTSFTATPGNFWLPSAFTALVRKTGEALSPEDVDTLGRALRRRDAAQIAQAKGDCSPHSLKAFSWDLFSAWLAAGAPANGRWALQALGDFGDDETARRLTPLIRSWPGEQAHQRAIWGLNVLEAIGSDTALTMLDGIAQRVKFRALQDHARDLIGRIAARRGLSREALSDRLVPELGLNSDGSKTLSFGTRFFRVGFTAKLVPFVETEAGKRLAELPKPNAKDDPSAAALSRSAWKDLKSTLKDAAPAILLRFELAMAAERRWSPSEFQELFVAHPLLIHLVRSLVWGVFGPDGSLTEPFRIGPRRELETFLNKPVVFHDTATVGLIHPLVLSEAQAGALADTMESDFEVPFEQLNRKVFTLSAPEWELSSLNRFSDRTSSAGQLRGLRLRGWRLGPPQDAGVVQWLTKPLGDGSIAVLNIGGLRASGDDPRERVALGPIQFEDDLEVEDQEQLADDLEQAFWFDPGNASSRKVDTRSRVAISELLRDLDEIVAPEDKEEP